MTAIRAALAALALTASGAAGAHDPYASSWYEADGWYDGREQYLYLSDTPLFRHDRLSRQRGFFDHGRLEGATFDYDRGYPYDRYRYEAFAPEPEPRRPPRCRTEWVPAREGGDEVPVRICTG